MKTKVEATNQAAINDFFDAFGTDTGKEYSESLLDLLVIVNHNKELGDAFKDDLVCKIKDLNRLILQLGAVNKVSPAHFESDFQKN